MTDSNNNKDQFLKIVIKNADGMVIVDMNGDIQYLNPAAELLFGISSEKIVGEPFGFPILSGDTSELEILQGKGKFTTVEMRTVDAEWEGQKVHLASLRDISDRVRMEADLRRRNKELEFINSTSQIFASMLNLDQVLTSTLAEIESQLGVSGSFWLMDDETCVLTCRQASGPYRESVIGYQLNAGEGIAGWVALNGESLLVEDVLEDNRHHNIVHQQTGMDIRSLLCIPLIYKRNILGVIQLIHKDVNHFNEEDRLLMNTLAVPAAIAVNNASLFTEVDNLRKFNQSIIQGMAEGVMITNAQGNIMIVNAAFNEITGYTEDEALGQTPRLLKSERHDSEFYKSMWHTLAESGRWYGEIWNRRKNGETYPQLLNISAIRDSNGTITHYVGAFTDFTKRVQAEEDMKHLATHDILTGLPNRGLFSDRLDHALERAARNTQQGAVMLLDIDHFKDINDTYGHSVGDRVLQEIADRLQKEMRRSDTVARLGGDEFTVILEEITSAEEVTAVARKILGSVSAPFVVNEQQFHPTVSIGISLYPADGEDVETLLMRSDIALYRAKEKRNDYCFFAPKG